MPNNEIGIENIAPNTRRSAERTQALNTILFTPEEDVVNIFAKLKEFYSQELTAVTTIKDDASMTIQRQLESAVEIYDKACASDPDSQAYKRAFFLLAIQRMKALEEIKNSFDDVQTGINCVREDMEQVAQMFAAVKKDFPDGLYILGNLYVEYNLAKNLELSKQIAIDHYKKYLASNSRDIASKLRCSFELVIHAIEQRNYADAIIYMDIIRALLKKHINADVINILKENMLKVDTLLRDIVHKATKNHAGNIAIVNFIQSMNKRAKDIGAMAKISVESVDVAQIKISDDMNLFNARQFDKGFLSVLEALGRDAEVLARIRTYPKGIIQFGPCFSLSLLWLNANMATSKSTEANRAQMLDNADELSKSLHMLNKTNFFELAAKIHTGDKLTKSEQEIIDKMERFAQLVLFHQFSVPLSPGGLAEEAIITIPDEHDPMNISGTIKYCLENLFERTDAKNIEHESIAIDDIGKKLDQGYLVVINNIHTVAVMPVEDVPNLFRFYDPSGFLPGKNPIELTKEQLIARINTLANHTLLRDYGHGIEIHAIDFYTPEERNAFRML